MKSSRHKLLEFCTPACCRDIDITSSCP